MKKARSSVAQDRLLSRSDPSPQGEEEEEDGGEATPPAVGNPNSPLRQQEPRISTGVSRRRRGGEVFFQPEVLPYGGGSGLRKVKNKKKNKEQTLLHDLRGRVSKKNIKTWTMNLVIMKGEGEIH